MAPASFASLGCQVGHDLDAVLPAADAVVMLRIQFERQEGAEGKKADAEVKGGGLRVAGISSVHEYREFYGMTLERAARLKQGAIVMHPGPMNRGIEIDGEVADGLRSAVFKQVAHGVAVRMAALIVCG
jgi:aspartate carbamoyltransferase catalytic subunit